MFEKAAEVDQIIVEVDDSKQSSFIVNNSSHDFDLDIEES